MCVSDDLSSGGPRVRVKDDLSLGGFGVRICDGNLDLDLELRFRWRGFLINAFLNQK